MISEEKRIYGVLGYPAKHSLSPLMHNAAFSALKINAEYKIFEVGPDELQNFILSLSEKNIHGLNVTIPYKEKVLQYLKWPSPEVNSAGAVNTIVVRSHNNLEGHNTDGIGFIEHLTEELGFDPKNKKVILFGAGGAAKAVAHQLGRLEARIIYIYDTDMERSLELAEKINKTYHKCAAVSLDDSRDVNLDNADLIINATPIGLSQDDPLLISADRLHSRLLVYDLVYNPAETRLLRAARENGASVSNGLGMLLHQGAASFELWTQQKAPIEIMRGALTEGAKNL